MDGVTVRFVGPVRRPGPERSMVVDRAGVRTVADLLARLGYSPREAERLTVLLDGVRAEPEAQLGGARTADILILIGGG
ncbi:MAG: hypothetical protein FJ087_17615 [Deltaproteobacteria bacterium]|nr:hypothetical protein [Deltaproteobacteria bacterium]